MLIVCSKLTQQFEWKFSFAVPLRGHSAFAAQQKFNDGAMARAAGVMKRIVSGEAALTQGAGVAVHQQLDDVKRKSAVFTTHAARMMERVVSKGVALLQSGGIGLREQLDDPGEGAVAQGMMQRQLTVLI